jgi:predicted metal-binding membrane protein
MRAPGTTVLEAVLRRDRAAVIGALIAVVAIAWSWILIGAGTGMTVGMTLESGMPGMAMMMEPATWTFGYATLMFVMWWVMMAAMMLPGAAPILLLFARVNRKEKAGGRPFVPTGIFAVGYLVAWGGFSLLATGLQWEFDQLGWLSPMMAATSYWLGSAILLAAGVWQLTPVKAVCLRHCRSPMSFLVQNWRPGRTGALRMGLQHGGYCLGCCWFLMGLLFFGGVMNLFWIIGLAGYILLEKSIPIGSWIGRIAGVGIAAWGVLMLVTMTLTIAAPNDYRFETVEVRATEPGKTTVLVRLIHLPNKKPIAGAVVLDAKTDMGPSGMAAMSGKVTQSTPDPSGLYGFLAETSMAGKWELILTAKVQGEAGQITGKLSYDAK